VGNGLEERHGLQSIACIKETQSGGNGTRGSGEKPEEKNSEKKEEVSETETC